MPQFGHLVLFCYYEGGDRMTCLLFLGESLAQFARPRMITRYTKVIASSCCPCGSRVCIMQSLPCRSSSDWLIKWQPVEPCMDACKLCILVAHCNHYTVPLQSKLLKQQVRSGFGMCPMVAVHHASVGLRGCERGVWTVLSLISEQSQSKGRCMLYEQATQGSHKETP